MNFKFQNFSYYQYLWHVRKGTDSPWFAITNITFFEKFVSVQSSAPYSKNDAGILDPIKEAYLTMNVNVSVLLSLSKEAEHILLRWIFCWDSLARLRIALSLSIIGRGIE